MVIHALNGSNVRRLTRRNSNDPARGRTTSTPHVLIIAENNKARRELERYMPPAASARSVRCAPETEGLGAEIVIIAGDFPLAELTEVRVHPTLGDKPVVLFAPNKDLPDMDWTSLGVWPVTAEHNALGQLISHVRHLLSSISRVDSPNQECLRSPRSMA